MRGLDKSPIRWLGALLTAIVVGGVVSPEVRSQTQTPDLSQGFALLRKAGLPDVKDWKYVRFDDGGGGMGNEISLESLLSKKPAGSGWLDPQPGKGNGNMRRILMDGTVLVAVSETGHEMDYPTGMQAAEAMGLTFAYGKYKEVNPAGGDAKQGSEASDAAELAAAVSKLAAGDDGKERLIQYRGTVVKIFFMAAHYHRRGFEKESAQIVSGLQQVLPRPEILVELAIEHLGDARLTECVARFRSDRDWKALQASLESVIADFPELWPARPLAERLLSQVKMRASGQPSPPVAGGPFSLTAEQQAWWKRVTEEVPTAKKGDEQHLIMEMQEGGGAELWGRMWLVDRLQIPEDLGRYWSTRQQKNSGLFDAARDWDWITVMAAALGDQTMTAMSSGNRSGGFSMISVYSGLEAAGELSEDELEQRWEQLGAPLTRDEVARAFLSVVLPFSEESGGSYEIRQMSVEDLRANAKSWSAKIAGKKGLELTRLYFKEGSGEHRPMMASVLARIGDEKDLALLEEMALSAPQNHLDLAAQILKKRKAAGKPFLDKFKKVMTEAWKEERGEEAVPDYINAQVQVLDGLVSGRGMKDLFADYASKKMDDNAFVQAVHSLQEGYEWTQEDVEAGFAAIGQIPVTQGRRRYVLMDRASKGLLSLLKIGGEEDPPDSGKTAPANANATPPPEWVVKLLKEFIEQNREARIYAWDGGSVSLSRHGYFMAETLWNPAGMARVQELYGQLSAESYWPYIEARGTAWLEGRLPPPVPDATRVTDSRKAEISAALQKVGEGAWPEYFAGLNLDEKLAVADLVEEHKPTESWRKALLTVTETSELPGVEAGAWDVLKGRALDGALAKQLLELCQQASTNDSKDIIGSVVFRSYYRGIKIAALRADREDRRQNELGRYLRSMGNSDASVPHFTAVAYVRWRNRTGDMASLVELRGKDGVWKPHLVGKDQEDGGFQPLRPVVSAGDFEKGVDALLAGWAPDGQEDWRIDFGVCIVPVDPAEKSE